MVPARRVERGAGCRRTASRSGTSGPTPTASSARSTACSGGPGRRPSGEHDRPDRRGDRRRSAATPTRAGSSCRRGTPPTSPTWRSRPATRCSSSTSPTASCRASSTSAAPTCSSACRSTSPPTRCSRTWSRSRPASRSGDFVWTGGDCHIYDNHLEQVREQLDARAVHPYPTLRITRTPDSIFDYGYDDFVDRRTTSTIPRSAAAVAV